MRLKLMYCSIKKKQTKKKHENTLNTLLEQGNIDRHFLSNWAEPEHVIVLITDALMTEHYGAKENWFLDQETIS